MQITHADLKSLCEGARVGPGPALVVFWWDDCPVGQALAAGAESIGSLAQLAVPDEILSHAARQLLNPSINKPVANASEAASDKQTASIVICTRDRPEELERCLASLPRQTRLADEIVVVDNASRTSRTRDVALAAGVEYVRENRPGLDIARNTGAVTSKGDIVCYTDDDVQLHPRWLERMVAAFDESQVMAVTGLVLPAELLTEAQQHFERYWSFGRGFRRADFGPAFFETDRTHGCAAWTIGAGASMAFRREVFDKVGLFDERLDVGAAGCSGDSEYWHRILSAGYVCRYEPSAVAYHYHRRDFAGLERQIHSYMRGHAAALLVQFERTRNWGNLRRVLVTMPSWYFMRAAGRLRKGRSEENRFLACEIRGFISGVLYYLGTPRPSIN